MSKILLVLVCMSCVISFLSAQIITFPWTEGFEGTTFPPENWFLVDMDGDNYQWVRVTTPGFSPYSGIGAAMSESFTLPYIPLTPDNYLISPSITLPESPAVLQWYIQTLSAWSPAEHYSVLISTTEPRVEDFITIFSESLSLENINWTERKLSLADYAGQTIYIAFRHHTPGDEFAILLDDISVYIPLSYDLEAVSLSGSQTPSVGMESIYTVQVRNVGGQTAENYVVHLMNGNNILSSLPGSSLASSAFYDCQLAWIPQTSGEMLIHAQIDWNIDENPENNQTPLQTINVLPSGFANIYLGNSESNTYDSFSPFSYGLENGIVQVIYLASDLPSSGLITHLTYKFNGLGNIINEMPARIYMTTTTQSSFSNVNSWVPFSNFTLVYEGLLPVNTAGLHEILIPLDFPFAYQDHNLVIMTHRVHTSLWYSGNRWQQTATPGENRTLYYQSTSYFDPQTSLPNGTRHASFANLALSMNIGGVGNLTGVITNAATGEYLDEVLVSIGDSLLFGLTNESGVYNINFIPAGWQQINVSKPGFIPEGLSTVLISANETTFFNIMMSPIPLITVTGTVFGSDTQLGLSEANVKLIGDTFHQIQTNAWGIFSFPAILTNQTYTIQITKEGYQPYWGSHTLTATSSIDLGSFTVYERLNQPQDVVVADYNEYVNITWQRPMAGNRWFTHSESMINQGVGTNQPATFIMVQRFTQEQLLDFGVPGAKLTKISFVPMRQAEYAVRIYAGGTSNPLHPGTTLYEQPIPTESLIFGQWNEIELSSEITIPLTGEFWIGVYINTPTGLPAGVDFGPQLHGLGNVMYFQGQWTYMGALSGYALPYNWLIKGYAEGIVLETSHSRILQNYSIYRLRVEDINQEENWTPISLGTTQVSIQDQGWSSLSSGEYRYAVKAIYDQNQISEPAFSTILGPNLTALVEIIISPDDQGSVQGAAVKLVNHDGNQDHIYQKYVEQDRVVFPSVWRGNYTLSISRTGYLSFENPNLLINTNPFSYTAPILVLNTLLAESFEGNIFPPDNWTLIDADGDNRNWLRDNFISVTGQHLALSQSAYQVYPGYWQPLTPDNYLITPPIYLNQGAHVSLHFYISSDPTYPNETYSILIGKDNLLIDNFTTIYTEGLEGDTAFWSRRDIDLSEFGGNTIYIAWRHHDSFDANLLGLDEIVLYSSGGTVSDLDPQPIKISNHLLGNYPNPFNPSTTISFSNTHDSQIQIKIYNIKGQKIRTLTNEYYPAGTHQILWNGTDDHGKLVSSGIYFCNLQNKDFSYTRKMLITK